MHNRLNLLFLLFISLCSLSSYAQPFDTVRVQQQDGYEMIQVLGNKTILAEGTMKNKMKEGVWNTYWKLVFRKK